MSRMHDFRCSGYFFLAKLLYMSFRGTYTVKFTVLTASVAIEGNLIKKLGLQPCQDSRKNLLKVLSDITCITCITKKQ
jgi:hypothetical protein